MDGYDYHLIVPRNIRVSIATLMRAMVRLLHLAKEALAGQQFNQILRGIV